MSTFVEKKNMLIENTIKYIWAEDDTEFYSQASRKAISREIDDILLLDSDMIIDHLDAKCITESMASKQREKSIERTRKYHRLYSKYMPQIGEDLWNGDSWLTIESKYPIKKEKHKDDIHSGYSFAEIPEITFGDTYIVKSVVSYLQESHLFYGLGNIAAANEMTPEQYTASRIGLDAECVKLAFRNLGIRF